MKVMETQEKIYVTEGMLFMTNPEITLQGNGNKIEYTRTDVLKAKEIDLKKEFDDYTKDISACDIQFEPFTQLYNCAKHFYELGLKSKGK